MDVMSESTSTLCRGCLASDRNAKPAPESLHNIIKALISNFQVSNVGALNFCWECVASMRKIQNFQLKILNSLHAYQSAFLLKEKELLSLSTLNISTKLNEDYQIEFEPESIQKSQINNNSKPLLVMGRNNLFYDGRIVNIDHYNKEYIINDCTDKKIFNNDHYDDQQSITDEQIVNNYSYNEQEIIDNDHYYEEEVITDYSSEIVINDNNEQQEDFVKSDNDHTDKQQDSVKGDNDQTDKQQDLVKNDDFTDKHQNLVNSDNDHTDKHQHFENSDNDHTDEQQDLVKSDSETSSLRPKRNRKMPAFSEYVVMNVADDKLDFDEKLDEVPSTKRKTKKFGKGYENTKCTTCNAVFLTNRALRYHRERSHKEKQKCNFCDREFSNGSAYKTHLLLHTGMPLFVCSTCGRSYRGEHGLKAHARTHAYEATEDAYCVACDKQFKNKYLYRHHLKTSAAHTDSSKFRFPCALCDKRFFVSSQLRTHVDTVHLKRRDFKCAQCSKAFSTKYKLKCHTAVAHDGVAVEKNHTCETCGRGFTTRQQAIRHTATHSAERSYACAVCPAKFKQPAALYTHNKLLHAKEK